ncbi:FAD-dependent oxidoreductase [Kozakia baliensis]|uniref:FAD-dependent oxidoreductase n=1 Tax=Kozakia baliensis TaxID=153496 RepID=UPI00089DC0DD|nr:FAD-dependent oxidoreductase [Kozakia baliensis]
MKTDIAIIGAGPYGLSLAAHLRQMNVDFQIFGIPMEVWRENMPQGMYLKSEGFACTLFDPKQELTLAQYCQAHGIDYASIGRPIERDLFLKYGEAFQRTFVSNLQKTHVQKLEREKNEQYSLTLANGETWYARRVIVACGISHFANLPRELAHLPADRYSHSARLAPLSSYAGKDIAVLGAGSSAVDVAGLLHQAGARAAIFTRRPKIWFNNPPERKSGLQQIISAITKPRSGLGLGWRSKMACMAPQIFHMMPRRFRLRVTQGHLGPSATWMSRQLIEGKVPIYTGVSLTQAQMIGDRVELTFKCTEGEDQKIQVDGVIAATGYVADVSKIPFISENILKDIRTERSSPILNRHFESSVPNLYFVGLSAANSFGPMLRFAWGAGFVARHLSSHLAGNAFNFQRVARLFNLLKHSIATRIKDTAQASLSDNA